jgi:L-asparaginase
MTRKRVYIAYTGGTIGMTKNARGEYAPAPGFLETQLRALPEFADALLPEFTIHEYAPLLDSANMTPRIWRAIARDIQAHYNEYDGFIVLHGTDTMAYTASALAFMLRGRKTIIVTGSQVSLSELRTDARDNLLASLILAAQYAIPEVCLYFGNRLLRGCRAVKTSAGGFDAFDSPNFPSLGKIGVDIRLRWDLILPPPREEELVVQEFSEPRVAALRLFPGISADVVAHILATPLQGLVLEAYGSGNGPMASPEFRAVLSDATARGIVIVATTQCLSGTVALGGYEASLASAGVTSGLDLTAEAALAKLFYLFSRGDAPEVVRQKMIENLRGELTPPM